MLTLAPGRFVSVAAAGWAFVAPLNVVTAPAPIVFVRLPFTVMVALRVRVHVDDAGSTPPEKVNTFDSTVPVSVPPQVPVLKLGGLAMIMPTGMVSVKLDATECRVVGVDQLHAEDGGRTSKNGERIETFHNLDTNGSDSYIEQSH